MGKIKAIGSMLARSSAPLRVDASCSTSWHGSTSSPSLPPRRHCCAIVSLCAPEAVDNRHQQDTVTPPCSSPTLPRVGTTTGQVEAMSRLGPQPDAGERAAAAAQGDAIGRSSYDSSQKTCIRREQPHQSQAGCYTRRSPMWQPAIHKLHHP